MYFPVGMTGRPQTTMMPTEVTNRFEELDKWISHIRSLGANAIYIGPLFESTSMDTIPGDYKTGGPGVWAITVLFQKNFCGPMPPGGHKRLFVDGVFNHTGREFFAFKDIQEKRWDSPYKGLV